MEKTPPLMEGLVVEDIPQTCAWLAGVLEDAFEGISIARAENLTIARKWLSEHWALEKTDRAGPPRIALIDLGLPDGSGIALVRDLAENYPNVMPVVITIYDDDAHLFDAIAAGAKGYLLKDQQPEILIKYLLRIQQGEPPLSPSIAQRMMAYFQKKNQQTITGDLQAESLTAREIEVLRLLAKGLRNSDVSRILGISEHTVAGYVKTIYRKLEICSRAEATLAAVNMGLL
ncbi:LuxR C-terminal-related transcriptional regulator [Kordiimonas pumila]|uniref:LuxR C-terminal-related transcriptional regulator n=2 Tax=Kordiimonas pumila TaxID=2161677 RepID=A0ABV7D7Y8_9PROT|nr:response regulator transcription factor [Kordiimonas pumila]